MVLFTYQVLSQDQHVSFMWEIRSNIADASQSFDAAFTVAYRPHGDEGEADGAWTSHHYTTSVHDYQVCDTRARLLGNCVC